MLITAVYILVVQPLAKAFLIVSQEDYVSVEMDLEEDTEKEENQEGKKTKKKINVRLLNHKTLHFICLGKSASTIKQQLTSNFDPEIPIPPPKTV